MSPTSPRIANNVAQGLWDTQITASTYISPEKYYDHLLEQYKLYVTMTDKISERRHLTNTFFLTLHTLLISGAFFLYEKGPRSPQLWLNLFPLAAAIILCAIWWRLILSYKQLNTAKFAVIGELEQRLPSSPYVRAEWIALGRGQNWRNYLPLSMLELGIPCVFAGLYIVFALAVTLLPSR